MKLAFAVIDLGTLPGGSMSKVEAINNRGQVVGWEGYRGRPFLWTSWIWQDGSLSALVMPREDLTSAANGVNDLGHIIGKTYQLLGDHRETDGDRGGLKALSVGPAGTRLGNKGHSHSLPFLVRDGHTEFFQHPDEGRVFLRAINNQGHIIGWLDTFHQVQHDRPPSKTRKSFLWRDGELTDITASDGGKFQAYDLNDMGDVVGTADSLDDNHASHAWLWQDGRMTDLGTLGWYSIPHAINSAGQVVGVSATDEQDEDNPVHGFLWDNGIMINLDGTSEVRASRPLAINAHGQIVGQLDIEDGPIYGFLWQDGKMHDLNELVAPELSWEILEAVDINDKGQIACNGERNGVSRGLLLTPL